MSILTQSKIIEAIEKGEIGIDPFEPENVGPGSIDLRLGDRFRVFDGENGVFDVDEEADHKKISSAYQRNTLVVQPQETVLGITKERITLPPYLCGWLEGRSRFARLGLMVHISASFMQPGISNHQVLEISNMGHLPMRLHANIRICQFVFQETRGEAEYTGSFQDQGTP
ncbi:MAG: dCTP deaminase [Flavobacteriales bacterium]